MLKRSFDFTVAFFGLLVLTMLVCSKIEGLSVFAKLIGRLWLAFWGGYASHHDGCTWDAAWRWV